MRHWIHTRTYTWFQVQLNAKSTQGKSNKKIWQTNWILRRRREGVILVQRIVNWELNGEERVAVQWSGGREFQAQNNTLVSWCGNKVDIFEGWSEALMTAVFVREKRRAERCSGLVMQNHTGREALFQLRWRTIEFGLDSDLVWSCSLVPGGEGDSRVLPH